MAYQDISSPAYVLSREITLTRGLVDAFTAKLAGLVAILGRIGTSVAMASSAQKRFEKAQALQARSDEELAALGLKRDDIPAYVFGDLYYA